MGARSGTLSNANGSRLKDLSRHDGLNAKPVFVLPTNFWLAAFDRYDEMTERGKPAYEETQMLTRQVPQPQIGDQPAATAVSGCGMSAGSVAFEQSPVRDIQVRDIQVRGIIEGIWPGQATDIEGHKRTQQYRGGRFSQPASSEGVLREGQHLDTQLPGRQAMAPGLTEPNTQLGPQPKARPAGHNIGAGGKRMV